MASGFCDSLAVRALEAGVLEASAVDVSAGVAAGPSAVDDTPAAAAVNALEGLAADAPGVATIVALFAPLGASGVAMGIRLDAAGVGSDDTTAPGATAVALG